MQTGTTFAILSNDEETPDERDRLDSSESFFQVSFFKKFHFVKESIWATGFIHVDSRYVISCSFAVNKLNEYRIIALIIKVI